MKKCITLFVFLLFAMALSTPVGCSKKEEPTKPAAKVVKPSEAEEKAEGAKVAEAKPATQIVETTKKYWGAFNANDLDAVMTCFSDDAIYQPGDGQNSQGEGGDTRCIRAAVQWGVRRDAIRRA